jgi:hypothetical protein
MQKMTLERLLKQNEEEIVQATDEFDFISKEETYDQYFSIA